MSAILLDLQENVDYYSSKVMLIAYWVGTIWEYDDSPALEYLPRNWFTIDFTDWSQRLGLWSWDTVRNVVDSFCISELVQPNCSLWVDAALEKKVG